MFALFIGRGRYVCDQCGIRCKKPSMLKKHIRTHSNDRPYTCSHCNFSFKTKGNLTKHMKSKAHTKNYAAYNSSSSSSSSAQQSGTPSSESDTEDSGMDSSDESSTRHQEREAVFGLLSLSQKPAVSENRNSSPNSSSGNDGLASFMDTEQIAHVTKTNYAKNKILDQAMNFNAAKLSEISFSSSAEIQEKQKLSQFLGKTNTTRPLTYPYTNASPQEAPSSSPAILTGNKEVPEVKTPVPLENSTIINVNDKSDPVKQFNVVKKYGKYSNSSSYKIQTEDPIHFEDNQPAVLKQSYVDRRTDDYENRIRSIQVPETPQNIASDLRKRKGSLDHDVGAKLQKSDSEVMDLSLASNLERKNQNIDIIVNGFAHNQEQDLENSNQISEAKKSKDLSNMIIQMSNSGDRLGVTETNSVYEEIRQENPNPIPYENEHSSSKNSEPPMEVAETNHVNINYVLHDQPNTTVDQGSFKQTDYDNSAMETLADIATKQEKLEKNSIAKNVATEFLKLAIKNECQNNDGLKESNFISSNKDVNELIGKPEENKSCTICFKSFCKPSQLKLHMNIHYLERPYRCDSCSVSFRTKGHLQKHERSASHHNKLSSSPNLSSSEPRPFKCSDCNIAFRIHGHLAKHLRAKMHIMKLECLNKIPFGLYAELERSNSLLTEINTTDGDQCLESLKV
ncbi:zinc finger protein, partial [Oryctes borbonicus]